MAFFLYKKKEGVWIFVYIDVGASIDPSNKRQLMREIADGVGAEQSSQKELSIECKIATRLQYNLWENTYEF
jgi:hypothetical protein